MPSCLEEEKETWKHAWTKSKPLQSYWKETHERETRRMYHTIASAWSFLAVEKRFPNIFTPTTRIWSVISWNPRKTEIFHTGQEPFAWSRVVTLHSMVVGDDFTLLIMKNRETGPERTTTKVTTNRKAWLVLSPFCHCLRVYSTVIVSKQAAGRGRGQNLWMRRQVNNEQQYLRE